jgi:MBOAT, membrane-bound O-acyltransferase family
MMPQFEEAQTYSLNMEDSAVGLTIFFIGLFKKTIIADGVAAYASPLFLNPGAPDLLSAWAARLPTRSSLINFDFSGYSDMAIGLSRVFGVKLPLNFDSPYKALNIIDFWRRWHITLSRFLRDYLYVSLGGNRKGTARRYLNLFVTMLLGGLWHGAGWTFVLWGGLHGAYLIVNHGWMALRQRLGRNPDRTTMVGRVLARSITFVAVAVGWVFFRATSVARALGCGVTAGRRVALCIRFHPETGLYWSSQTGGLFRDVPPPRPGKCAGVSLRGPKTVFQAGERPAPGFDAVDNIIARAPARGVKLRFVLYPYHAHTLVLFELTDLWPAYEDWKRELVRRVDGARGAMDVELWDFTG